MSDSTNTPFQELALFGIGGFQKLALFVQIRLKRQDLHFLNKNT
jgi:hypothetical protein